MDIFLNLKGTHRSPGRSDPRPPAPPIFIVPQLGILLNKVGYFHYHIIFILWERGKKKLKEEYKIHTWYLGMFHIPPPTIQNLNLISLKFELNYWIIFSTHIYIYIYIKVETSRESMKFYHLSLCMSSISFNISSQTEGYTQEWHMSFWQCIKQ